MRESFVVLCRGFALLDRAVRPASNLVGRVYVYASCWNAKNHVILSDMGGRFSGHVSLPRLCIRRRAKRVFADVVWGGSTNFTAAQVEGLFRITR